jgi:signal peptidase I
VLGLAVVAGRSMEPTVRDGDRLLVRHGARPRLGRVAVVRLPDRPLSVKRLALCTAEGWWVERDNPLVGTDSWTPGVGPVPDTDVVGLVVARVWPRPRLLRSRPRAAP